MWLLESIEKHKWNRNLHPVPSRSLSNENKMLKWRRTEIEIWSEHQINVASSFKATTKQIYMAMGCHRDSWAIAHPGQTNLRNVSMYKLLSNLSPQLKCLLHLSSLYEMLIIHGFLQCVPLCTHVKNVPSHRITEYTKSAGLAGDVRWKFQMSGEEVNSCPARRKNMLQVGLIANVKLHFLEMSAETPKCLVREPRFAGHFVRRSSKTFRILWNYFSPMLNLKSNFICITLEFTFEELLEIIFHLKLVQGSIFLKAISKRSCLLLS